MNTADSRVELSVRPLDIPGLTEHQKARLADRLGDRLVDGVLTVVASENRAQLDNRRAARERLGALLREAAAPPPATRRPTRPTRGSKERRLAGKKRRGEIKRGRRAQGD